jgi:hypothetical protein
MDGVMTTERMLAGFAEYIEPPIPIEHCIIGTPLGARCKRIERITDGWKVWIATNDYIYGTALFLFNDGKIVHATTRQDEGDDVFVVRPSDDGIRRTMK